MSIHCREKLRKTLSCLFVHVHTLQRFMCSNGSFKTRGQCGQDWDQRSLQLNSLDKLVVWVSMGKLRKCVVILISI